MGERRGIDRVLDRPIRPARQRETHRVVIMAGETEVADVLGGVSACAVVAAPLDVYEEPPAVRGGKAVLVGSRAGLGSEKLLEAARPVVCAGSEDGAAVASVLVSCAGSNN